jgi:hypothetical protein
VKKRPKDRIRKTVVVFLDLVLGEADGLEVVADINACLRQQGLQRGNLFALFFGTAEPSDPKTAAVSKNGVDGGNQSSGAGVDRRIAVIVMAEDDRQTVRNYGEAS